MGKIRDKVYKINQVIRKNLNLEGIINSYRKKLEKFTKTIPGN